MLKLSWKGNASPPPVVARRLSDPSSAFVEAPNRRLFGRLLGVVARRIVDVAVVIVPRLGGTICTRVYRAVPGGPQCLYTATTQRLRPLIRLA